MSGFKLGNSLSLNKKPGTKKPTGPPAKKNAFFGGGDDSEDDSATPFVGPSKATKKSKAPQNEPTSVQAITELDDDAFLDPTPAPEQPSKSRKSKITAAPAAPPSLKSKKTAPPSALGDLSSALESRKQIEAAEDEDANIYDYDAVYDALKPTPKAAVGATAEEARPRYMTGIVTAAAVRKRDHMAAEQVRMERERDAEGDEFADKDVFVTASYKKAQEDKKAMDAELKKIEEAEAKKREGGTGMTDFYKKLLDDKEEEHKRIMEAAARRSKMTREEREKEDEEKRIEEKSMAERAREINELGGNIAINDDGEVVDKRQLLRGGLNILQSRKTATTDDKKPRERALELVRKEVKSGGAGGRKAARERQSQMMEEQLAESLKRAREEEEAERKKIENMNKSRKTEADVSSARERYLARKKAAEEAKKQKA